MGVAMIARSIGCLISEMVGYASIPFMAPCLGTIARRLKISIILMALCDNIIPHEPHLGANALSQYFVNQVDHFMVMSRAVEKDMERFVSAADRIRDPESCDFH